MANLSFKEFLDLEEKVKPSTICAGIRKLAGNVDCQAVLDGMGPTPVSNIVMKAPGNRKTLLNIPMSTVTFDLSKDRRTSDMKITPDEVTNSIYANDDEDIVRNKYRNLTVKLPAVKTDKMITNGLPIFKGAAGAAPAGGLGGMIA